MSDYYEQSNIFRFNLIPPKTKEEVKVLVERDNSILYAFILVFTAMFVYFVLTMAQALVITPRVTATKKVLSDQDTQITSYDTVKKMKGELFVKSEALAPILEKDIKISQLLDLGKTLVGKIPSSNITSYGREVSGSFVITFVLTKIEDASLLLSTMRQHDEIKNLFLRDVGKDESHHNVEVVVSFTLLGQ